MHVALVLLTLFAMLSTRLLLAHWYHSQGQLRAREARAKILHPYKR